MDIDTETGLRLTPERHLEAILGSLADLEGQGGAPPRVYATVQLPEDESGKLEFPAVVYQAVGGEEVSSFSSGPVAVSRAFRLDFRAEPGQGCDRTAELGEKAIQALREGGRLRDLSGPVDDYDEEVEVHRRIWTVEITV